MIDQRIVGAIVAGDLRGYRLTADDARFIVRQRVATPVHNLVQEQPEAADDEAKAILDRAARRVIVHSMLQVTTSNQVAGMLEDAEIHALVYKGVALAAAQSGAWRGRESVDVDVIIDPADVVRAHEVLIGHGLARVDGKSKAPNALFRYHDIEMAYRGLPTAVDLHWRLESPGYLDIPFPELWAGRRRLTGDGLDVWTLGSPDTVLVSAVHGTREGWRTLRHMLDASLQLSGMPSEQWERVTQTAATCGARKSLAVALAVSETCETANLPALAGVWARPVADEFVDSWAARALGPKPTAATSPADAIHRRSVRWRMAPRPSAALDSLIRSGARQVLHKRSWTLSARSQ